MKNDLKAIRKKTGMTQKEFAQKISIPFRTYQNYEIGQRKPDVYIAKAIAKALNSTVEELFK